MRVNLVLPKYLKGSEICFEPNLKTIPKNWQIGLLYKVSEWSRYKIQKFKNTKLGMPKKSNTRLIPSITLASLGLSRSNRSPATTLRIFCAQNIYSKRKKFTANTFNVH